MTSKTRLTLDLKDSQSFDTLILHRGDSKSRVIEIELTDNHAPVTLTSGMSATINASTNGIVVADGEKATVDTANNIISFTVTDNMTSLPGQSKISITVTEGESVITAQTFRAIVTDAVINEGSKFEPTGGTVKQFMDEVTAARGNADNLKEALSLKIDNDIYDYINITLQCDVEAYYYKYSDGSKISNENCKSVYISCNAGDKFRISGKTAGNTALAVFFDTAKNYLSAVCYGSVTDYVDEIVNIPTDCCYAAFTSYGTDLVVKKYQPTGNKLTEKIAQSFDDINYLKSNFTYLKGKSLYVDGDSIMYGYGSDGYAVGEFLRDKYGMTLAKGAVSGATLAVKADSDNSICTRLTALSDIYDYIIFDGGVNDVSQDITLGEITNHYKGGYDTTTTIGALEQICYTLVTNFLTVKKLFVFTHKIVNVSNPVMSDKMITCNNAIKSILNKWGIPYVDLYNECNLCAINDTINNAYFKLNSEGVGDRVHPTKDAYAKFYMPLIEANIKAL